MILSYRKCPKCSGKLFYKHQHPHKPDEYYCLYCGIEGTWDDMQHKLNDINRIIYENIPMYHCFQCGKKYKLNLLTQYKDNNTSKFLCNKCLSKVLVSTP